MDRPTSLPWRSVDLANEAAFQLGRAEFDPQAHEWVFDGESMRLQPQTLKVLVALHDKLGQVVTRDELIDRCWNGRIVGDDVINRCISLLRPIASKSDGFTIETIPRSGYRLVSSQAERTTTPSAKPKPRRRVVITIIAVLVIGTCLLGIASYFWLDRGDGDALVAIQTLSKQPGDRPAQALAEGLAEAVGQRLSGSGTPVQIAEGGGKQAPSLMLRGSSISDSGRIYASLQLISQGSGTVIWSATFNRQLSELEDFQSQIALQVANELHCAYAYGRGPYFDRDSDLAKLILAHCDSIGKDDDESVRLDAQIVKRAPQLARGWSEYAIDSVFAADDLPPLLRDGANRHAIDLAHHALALDRHQGLAYVAIGTVRHRTSSWPDMNRFYLGAIAADPTSPELHNFRSGMLSEIGRLQDSIAEAKLSYQDDHFLPGKVDQLARTNAAAGYFDDAEDELVLARQNWPDAAWIADDEVWFGVAGDQPRRALELVETGAVRISSSARRQLEAFLRWRIAPNAGTRLAAIDAIKTGESQLPFSAKVVQMAALLGDNDLAFTLAARLPPQARGPWMGPGLEAFRADPRFYPLAAREGVVQAWKETGLWPDFCTGHIADCRNKANAAIAAMRRQ